MIAKTLQLKELHPQAVDWIDAGGREIRRQIEEYADRAGEKSGQPSRYTFPVKTSVALEVLIALGYDATRSYLDYLVRYRWMRPPPRRGRRLMWSIAHITQFGLLLERLRHWRAGCHDEKKTVWELQAEWELQEVVYTADDHEVQEVDIDEMFGAVIDPGSIERRAEPANSSADRLDTSDAAVEALLGESIEEPSTSQHKAFGVALGGGKRSISRGHRRTGGAL